MSSRRRRLDAELVRRGLTSGREQAKQAVAQYRVLVNGAVAQKPAQLVLPGDAVELAGRPARYVSRGGDKLQSALTAFKINPNGLRCCDVGASTGGFTDCLLQHGAASVVSIDVGRAQMHERLLTNPKVAALERTDVRKLDVSKIAAPFDLVTADLSFISLSAVMSSLVSLVAPKAPLVVLVKPQFEVGRRYVARSKGVIRDPELWQEALDMVLRSVDDAGLAPQSVVPSVLRGAKGNAEFFLYCIRDGQPVPLDVSQAILTAESSELSALVQ